jgi:hypothetical protein
MAGSQKKQLALDTNLLLDLAASEDFAEDFKGEFQARGYDLLVPPTVGVELNVLSIYGTADQKDWLRKHCTASLLGLPTLCSFRCKAGLSRTVPTSFIRT